VWSPIGVKAGVEASSVRPNCSVPSARAACVRDRRLTPSSADRQDAGPRQFEGLQGAVDEVWALEVSTPFER